jgi:hypothetical protein
VVGEEGYQCGISPSPFLGLNDLEVEKMMKWEGELEIAGEHKETKEFRVCC